MLNPTLLKTQLSKFMDSEDVTFTGFPQTTIQSATLWADALEAYVLTITPPVQPSVVTSAKGAFITSFNAQILAKNVLAGLPLSITSFASALVPGFLPLFIATPPVTPLILLPAYNIGLLGGTAKDVLDIMCPIIDTWFKTGIAVNQNTGVTTTWL
jgi:hypothetical protein